jgi:hypothetical protein
MLMISGLESQDSHTIVRCPVARSLLQVMKKKLGFRVRNSGGLMNQSCNFRKIGAQT